MVFTRPQVARLVYDSYTIRVWLQCVGTWFAVRRCFADVIVKP